MSNNVNTKLYETASELIDYWTGTQWADRIELAINSNDLEQLYQVCREAHQAMLSIEYNPSEVTDVY